MLPEAEDYMSLLEHQVDFSLQLDSIRVLMPLARRYLEAGIVLPSFGIDFGAVFA